MQVSEDLHALCVHVHIEQPSWRLGDEEGTGGEDESDDALDGEGDTPGEIGGEEGGKVVDPLRS